MVNFGRFFPKLGFSLHIINLAVRISEAAMKEVGDIIFHNFGAQMKGTPSYCEFFARFVHLLFAERISEVAMGGGGKVGGHYIS